jgi:hypothetical protein
MRKVVGIVALATSLIGNTTGGLAQSTPTQTYFTGTNANRVYQETGRYPFYGGGGPYSYYRSPPPAWAFVPHRRSHSYRRHARR